MLAARLIPVLLTLALAACQGERPATKTAPSPRLVSLAPAITATLSELGARDHLVGVTSWCDAPGVPVVGDFKPRPEAVLAARPDLVLMASYGSQAPDLAPLTALGLATRAFQLVTLEDMRRTTLALGELVGRDARPVVARLDDALTAAKARIAARGAPVRVLLVYGLEPGAVITTGGGDHISELLEALGAHNVAATEARPVTVKLGLERVLELAPELILHAAPDASLPDSAAALAHWSTWPTLPAVARREVYVFPRDTLARNGPHLAAEVPALAALLDSAAAKRPPP